LRQFFILPRPAFGIALGLDKGSGLAKREIVAFSSDPGTWAIGAKATGNASQRQVLYEIIP
jgi:hypothetical protein